MNIRGFKLKNQGIFAVNLHVLYQNEGEEERVEKADESHVLAFGGDQTIDMRFLGFKNGCKVKLKVHVIWGIDNVAKQEFVYRDDAETIVEYVITGVTLWNNLSMLASD